jgi:5-methylcytosine-specific restriction endonuclease McrA
VEDPIPGKKCSRCGIWKPLEEFDKHFLRRRSECIVCRRKYYVAHREEILAKMRLYKEQYPDKVRQTEAQRRQKEERKEYQRRYREANAERLREYDRRYNRERSEIKAAHSHNRRTRKKQAEGTFTAEEWEALKQQYHYSCLCCGKQEPEIRLEPDHVVPLAKGGSNWIANIQPLCKRCNDRKKTNTIDYRPNW